MTQEYDDEAYPEHSRIDPQFEQSGDYAGEFDYLKEEKYQPTPADQALYTSLVVTEIGQAILQARVDGEISQETYNKLYEVNNRALVSINSLLRRLEIMEKRAPHLPGVDPEPGPRKLIYEEGKE